MNTGRVFLAGLVASMVMGMIQMIWEAMAGAGFWSPVVFIAATVMRDLQHVSIPVPFLLMPVILGLMGHMMNSVILGFIFGTIVRNTRSIGALILEGVIYSIVVFLVMWFLVVPAVDPVMRHLNGGAFFVAHLMWGAALGLVIGWQRTVVGTQQSTLQH